MEKTRFLDNLELKDWQRKFNPKPADTNRFLFEPKPVKPQIGDLNTPPQNAQRLDQSFSW